MRFTLDEQGPAVSCPLADWLARGPGVPHLDRLVRVTIEEVGGDAFLPDVPPAISDALHALSAGGNPAGVSEACLGWAKARTPHRQMVAAAPLSFTPPPRPGPLTVCPPTRPG